MSSIIVPSCLSLCENNYELSIEVDADEESEKNKEIKIFTIIDEYCTKQQLITLNNIFYLSKNYTSVSLNLDSPPPEVIV